MSVNITYPPVCPYCGQRAEFMSSKHIYSGRDYGMLYVCLKCQAWCGVHKKTNQPLGTLANAELRGLRVQCHDAFDRLWKGGAMSRTLAYKWLREQFPQLTAAQCHIGCFDPEQCRQLLQILLKRNLKPNVLDNTSPLPGVRMRSCHSPEIAGDNYRPSGRCSNCVPPWIECLICPDAFEAAP